MRIAIDIDNTLHDFFEQLQASLSEEGIKIGEQERLVYGSWEQLKTDKNLSYFERCHSDEYIGSSELFEGALEAIRDLSNRGHQTFFISSRPEKSRGATERWLRACGFEYEELLISEGGSDKRAELKSVQIDLVIDDDPGVIVAALNEGMLAGCLEKPWNQNFKAVRGVMMARDWRELKRLIDEVIEDPPKSWLGKLKKHLLP